MLGARQMELSAAIDLHERKAAYHSQELRRLRGEKRALAEEQQGVQDAIDPEATAAARLEAAQARAAAEEAELQSRRQFAVRGSGGARGCCSRCSKGRLWGCEAVLGSCHLPACTQQPGLQRTRPGLQITQPLALLAQHGAPRASHP